MNGAVHAVKLDGKCNEAHKDLIRHHGMSPVATSAELYHVYCTWTPPMPLNCASQSSCFLCVNGAELAVKLHGKCEEAHTDLTRHRGMSPVTTSAELYHVYRTWEFPRRCTSQRSAGASAMRNLDYIHPWNIAWSSFRYARGFIRPKH